MLRVCGFFNGEDVGRRYLNIWEKNHLRHYHIENRQHM